MPTGVDNERRRRSQDGWAGGEFSGLEYQNCLVSSIPFSLCGSHMSNVDAKSIKRNHVAEAAGSFWHHSQHQQRCGTAGGSGYMNHSDTRGVERAQVVCKSSQCHQAEIWRGANLTSFRLPERPDDLAIKIKEGTGSVLGRTAPTIIHHPRHEQ